MKTVYELVIVAPAERPQKAEPQHARVWARLDKVYDFEARHLLWIFAGDRRHGHDPLTIALKNSGSSDTDFMINGSRHEVTQRE